MKPSIGLANLRQLACCGYGARLVAPALVETLRAHVGFDICSLVWVDDQCRPTDFYSGQLRRPDLHRLYLSRYFGQLEGEAMPTSAALLQSALPFDTAQQYGRRYYHSTFYDAICRPVDLHHALRIALRDGGKPVAVMVLGRPPGSKNFARPDFERIQAARPYIEHALSAADGAFDEETAPSGETGVAIIDASLNLLHLSPGTENLLRMAAQEGMFGLPPGECMAAAKGIFRPLVARIKGVYARQECEPPAQHLRNAWGQFTLRAYRLAPVGSASSGLIGVTIARHVPLTLRLLGVPAIQALPRREKEVCLLLLKGMQTQEMSRHLGISQHTVVTYVRGLYRQLGVAGRGELLGLLRREANRSLDGAAGAGTLH